MSDDAWQRHSLQERAQLPAREQHDALCRRYHVHQVSTAGIEGGDEMLIGLGLLKGTSVAAYVRSTRPRPPPVVMQQQDQPEAPATPTPDQVILYQRFEVVGASHWVHLINSNYGHWQAFVLANVATAAAASDDQALAATAAGPHTEAVAATQHWQELAPGAIVQGQLFEAGGGGDCMFYAFMASTAAQLDPADWSAHYRPDKAAMLALRQQLADYLDQQWATPLCQLGGRPHETRTLGDVFRDGWVDLANLL